MQLGSKANDKSLQCASVKADEEEFVKVLKKRAEDGGGNVKVVDVSKKESEVCLHLLSLFTFFVYFFPRSYPQPHPSL